MARVTWSAWALLLALAGCGSTSSHPFSWSAPAAAPAAEAKDARAQDLVDGAKRPVPPPAGSISPRGYVLPGEQEPVEEVLLSWSASNYAYLETLAAVIETAAAATRVRIVVADDGAARELASALSAFGVPAAAVSFLYAPVDTMWVRDFGPLVLRDEVGRRRVVDLPYHRDRPHDDAVPEEFARSRAMPRRELALLIEGGHLLSDGTGRCVLTDAAARASMLSPDELEELLAEALGCRRLTFVPELFGEDTGHVDMFIHLPGPGRALVGEYRDGGDPYNARRLDEAAAQLRASGFQVVRVPMPSHDGRTAFRSYTNLLVLNGTVIVPVFRESDRHEAEALRIIAEWAHPDREVVAIEADDLVELAGLFHCLAVGIPAPVPPGISSLPPPWRERPTLRPPTRVRGVGIAK